MKVWIKYLIGSVLGIIAAFILPMHIPALESTLVTLSEIAIRFGRYALIPLVFFGTAMSLFNLRHKKHILKTSAWLYPHPCFHRPSLNSHRKPSQNSNNRRENF